jgi:hypothetical protein
MRDIARPMPRAPPETIMFLGGAWNAMFGSSVESSVCGEFGLWRVRSVEDGSMVAG